MSKKLRHALYLDGDVIVAETDVIRFAVGDHEASLRSDVWTFFGSLKKPDFYFTSSLVSSDQKVLSTRLVVNLAIHRKTGLRPWKIGLVLHPYRDTLKPEMSHQWSMETIFT